jgi:hypothetical protein
MGPTKRIPILLNELGRTGSCRVFGTWTDEQAPSPLGENALDIRDGHPDEKISAGHLS